MATNHAPSPPMVVYNQSAVKSLLWVCDVRNTTNWATSQGCFLGDNPLDFSLPLLLLEVTLIFWTSRATHHVLKHLGQSRTVSHIVAGILLGPSVIGRNKTFTHAIFPPRGAFVLDTLSIVSLIFFLFNIGVKTDLRVLRKPGKIVVAIALLSSLPSFILCCIIFFAFKQSFPSDLRNTNLITLLASRFSLTSFPVLGDILDELGLLNSDIGRIAMSSALISDVISWFASAVFTAVVLGVTKKSVVTGILAAISLLGFTMVILLVARPLSKWAIRKVPAGELLGEGCFIGFVLMALLSAWTTELLGFHATLGPVILGLVLPGGMPLGVTLTERMDCFISGMFLPIYLVLAGYRTNFSKLNSLATWGYLELVIAVNFVGKFIGSMVAPLYCKMPIRDALSLGLIMNLKGIVEVSFLNVWGDNLLANAQHYSVVMMSIVITTAVCTPLIKYLHKPTTRYVAHKRRTLQHSKRGSELRVLACVHEEDNVGPIIELLEASNAGKENPLSVVVLHLTELAGRAAAILASYKRNKKAPNGTPSDRIVNAFRYFEQQNPGGVSVHPYVASAPAATMHNDICSLALEKKVRLVILPFHKQSVGGAIETARHARQNMNRNVLDYAPCSVAILIDRGLSGGTTCSRTNNLLSRVAVYFLGGADDREALAYGTRMARSSNIALTVVRLVPKEELGVLEEDEEWKLDDEMMNELISRQADYVLYKEERVEDGEGTVAVIRSMSEKFDLLIVGRRKGMESALTTGLSVWSECPELGVVGDMLASTDFGGKVSILVVQQQDKVAGGDPTPLPPPPLPVAGDEGPPRSPGSFISNIISPTAVPREEVKNVLIHGEKSECPGWHLS